MPNFLYSPPNAGPVTISGIVSRIYTTAANFSAGVLDADNGRQIRFSGKFMAVAGEALTLTGQWQTHPKYGDQFMADGLSYEMPQTPEGLIRYLAKSPAFRGIGEVAARRLVEYAGTAEHLDQLIRDGQDELQAALHLPAQTLQTLREAWIARAEENSIRSYLSSFELTTCQMDDLLERFGEGIVGILKTDPYQLIRQVPGYGFKRVDAIARKVGVPKDHPGRIRAGMVFTVEEAIRDGHTWIDAEELIRKANVLLFLDSADSRQRIEAAGRALIESGDLVAEGAAISLPDVWDDERFIFDTLAMHAGRDGHMLPAAPALTSGLLPGQRAAFELAFACRVCVITGAAGTGKSLTISRIARAFRDAGLTVTVCAPTGKAAKRAEELMNRYGLSLEAKTIHRLLGYNGIIYQSGMLDTDVLIADECSMISVDLMAELLRRIDFTRTALVLVGDHNQLPSVGPGSVLRDIIRHKLAPVAELTEVVRQAGVLKTNSTAVLAGHVAQTEPSEKEWLVIDRFSNPADIQACLRELIRTQILQYLHYDPLREVQIITPTHKGTLGTRELNKMLQTLHHGPVKGRFTIGDRVVQKANDYDLEIFNGSIGTITGINNDGIHIDFDLEGHRQLVPDKQNSLQLAYCLTIHSMQGSEAPCVILILHRSHWHACRQLFYTGVTRASKTLILLGDARGIQQAVRNQRSAERRTLMSLWAKHAELQ